MRMKLKSRANSENQHSAIAQSIRSDIVRSPDAPIFQNFPEMLNALHFPAVLLWLGMRRQSRGKFLLCFAPAPAGLPSSSIRNARHPNSPAGSIVKES